MTDRYPYRITSRRGDLTLIWQAGKGDALDTLAVDDRGRLLAFHDAGTLARHCADRGWDLDGETGPDEVASLDLEPARRWAEGPYDGPAPTGPLLEAWNFFEDLARSVSSDRPLPRQGEVHDGAYEKFFDADAGGAGAWTDEEAAAARDLLRAGLGLWEESACDALVL
ncbi:hypothetical protein ABZY68_36680 [Streptomyces sp. NPDC006482]|uniref:hypothetical protein n=1 Tax=Streptomyces sp. NPDC006482 TaxID=3154306 RepID=UPI0033AEFEF3